MQQRRLVKAFSACIDVDEDSDQNLDPSPCGYDKYQNIMGLPK